MSGGCCGTQAAMQGVYCLGMWRGRHKRHGMSSALLWVGCQSVRGTDSARQPKSSHPHACAHVSACRPRYAQSACWPRHAQSIERSVLTGCGLFTTLSTCRANAQQPKLFVGMILILIFAEALALYGLIGECHACAGPWAALCSRLLGWGHSSTCAVSCHPGSQLQLQLCCCSRVRDHHLGI